MGATVGRAGAATTYGSLSIDDEVVVGNHSGYSDDNHGGLSGREGGERSFNGFERVRGTGGDYFWIQVMKYSNIAANPEQVLNSKKEEYLLRRKLIQVLQGFKDGRDEL